MQILKMERNTKKKYLVFKINAFELVEVNSPCYGDNLWHRPWMALEAVLEFKIWQRWMFYSSIFVRMIKNWDESALLHTSAVFGT